jgi:hypothetical protein
MARHSASPRKRKFSPVPIFRTISFVIKLYTCFFEGYFGKLNISYTFMQIGVA